MKRSREELVASNNGGSSPNKITGSLDGDEEVKDPPLTQDFIKKIDSNSTLDGDEEVKDPPLNLNLSLTITQDFTKKIEPLLQQQQQGHDSNSTPRGSSPNKITRSLDYHEEFIKKIEPLPQQQQQQQQGQDSNSTPRGKTKAMRFPISKITIGEWTHEAVYEHDLKAKIYFAKKKILWESFHDKRKIEMPWDDVLSLQPLYHPHDQTGILRVELRKPPTFWLENNTQPLRATQWKEADQDFTLNRSASRYRIHTLYFAPGVLQENMEKLSVLGDGYWSELFKVHFPTSEDLYFDDTDYGNSKNNMMAPREQQQQ